MIKIIDLVYHCHEEFSRPGLVIQKHLPSIGFAYHLNNRIALQFVKHMNGEGIAKMKGINYIFFKRKNKYWQIPFKTHRFIKQQNPDIIVVEGLIFPLQLLFFKTPIS